MTTSVDARLPIERRIGRNLPQPVPADVKLRARTSLRDWNRKACLRFGREFELPSISFDLRGVTTMGQAWVGENHVQLNASGLVSDEACFTREVIPHELSHLLAYRLYGSDISPHGEEWQNVMRALGLEPNVTYEVEQDPDNSGPYIYACLCGEHGVSARRHNLIWRSKGTKVLECQKCGSVLSFKALSEQGGVNLREPEPTSKMLHFAEQISKRCGVSLPEDARQHISACRAFIERYKNISNPASPSRDSALPENKADVIDIAPSELQLRYALSIASRKETTIPVAVSKSRKLLSTWIDRNK